MATLYFAGRDVATSIAAGRSEAPDSVPGLDLGRITAQVNDLWDAYGDLMLAVAALAVLATCVVVWRRLRKVPANRLIALVAVAPTLVWTSHGVWNVTVNALGMAPGIAVFAFLVFEAMLLNAGYEAEQHRRRYGTPGPHGRYVWVIAPTTGTIASLGDPTLGGSVARFVLPLVAAGLWWTTLTAPRETDTKRMIATRQARARGWSGAPAGSYAASSARPAGHRRGRGGGPRPGGTRGGRGDRGRPGRRVHRQPADAAGSTPERGEHRQRWPGGQRPHVRRQQAGRRPTFRLARSGFPPRRPRRSTNVACQPPAGQADLRWRAGPDVRRGRLNRPPVGARLAGRTRHHTDRQRHSQRRQRAREVGGRDGNHLLRAVLRGD